MKKLLTAVLVLLLFAISLHGQDAVNDTLAKANPQALYNQSTQQQQQLRLYNGTQHTGYSPSIGGHAYYQTRDWQKGSLIYDGIQYNDVSMLYDLYKDQAVIRHSNDIFIIGLISSKVASFTMAGHRFTRIEDTLPGMRAGFYQVLAEGQVMALARRTKIMREFTSQTSNKMQYEFVERHRYYIKKDGTYHTIRSDGDILDALSDQRAQVKQFLRKNNIRFRRDAELAMVKAVEYYASLKK